MNTIHFKEENFQKNFEMLLPIFVEHYKEISRYQDIPLSIDKDLYFKMEEMGMLKTFIARGTTNKILGYAIYFVKTNMHYSKSLQASQDVLYVQKESRGEFGEKFINWCDDQLRALGVQIVYHHVKTKFNFGSMLERNGYEHVENIYAKRLD